MQQLFAAHHFVCREVRPLSVLGYYGLSNLIVLLNKLQNTRFVLGRAVCPLCGFHNPSAQSNDSRPLQRYPRVKQFTKRIWPKKRFDRWLMATYERVGAGAAVAEDSRDGNCSIVGVSAKSTERQIDDARGANLGTQRGSADAA
jgi:hypothetical protein